MRVMITGAAGAIGAATAATLSARGHEVIATARDPGRLSGITASQRLGLDVTDPASITEALAQAGEVDAVVNNAALTAMGPLEDFPIERVKELFDVNCLGPLRVVQAVASRWRARGSGVIVNLSSVQGRVATPLEGAYAATKFALEALSEAIHYELSHFGIRTVIVEPGYTAPGMQATEHHRGPPEYAELWEQWSDTDTKVTGPGGRPGPETVATAIADAIEDPTTALRVALGQDTEMVLAARGRLDDAGFEAAMRTVLGMTW